MKTEKRERKNPERISNARREDRLSGPGEGRLLGSDLFAESRVVVIEHEGEEYRLRLTSKGKLILTK